MEQVRQTAQEIQCNRTNNGTLYEKHWQMCPLINSLEKKRKKKKEIEHRR